MSIIIIVNITIKKVFIYFYKLKALALIFLLLLISVQFSGQNKLLLDSLQVQLKYTKHDSNRVKTLWQLSDYFWGDDLRQSYSYSTEALSISKKINDTRLIAVSHQKVGDAFFFMGDYSKALKNYLESLEKVEQLGDKVLLFTLYHNMGALMDRLKDFDQALNYYNKALYVYNNSEEKSNPTMQSVYTLYNSIANIYTEKDNKKTALNYY